MNDKLDEHHQKAWAEAILLGKPIPEKTKMVLGMAKDVKDLDPIKTYAERFLVDSKDEDTWFILDTKTGQRLFKIPIDSHGMPSSRIGIAQAVAGFLDKLAIQQPDLFNWPHP